VQLGVSKLRRLSMPKRAAIIAVFVFLNMFISFAPAMTSRQHLVSARVAEMQGTQTNA